MDDDFEIKELKQIAIKTRVIIVSCIIIGALFCIAVILFYQPRVTIDTGLILEKQRQLEAIERNNEALQGLVDELKKGKDNAYIQDSILIEEVKLNRAAIKKIPANEKIIKVFNSYGSNEWTAYFSKLPEPQR